MTVTLVVCAAACLALYIGLSISLHREVDGFLEGEVQEFLSILNEDADGGFTRIEDSVRHELGSRLRKDLSFRLLDSSGAAVVLSNVDDALPDPWTDVLPPQRSAQPQQFTTVNPAGTGPAVRVCSQWVDLRRHGVYLAQATYSLSGVESSLATFRRLCAGAMILAGCLSLIGGRLLARRILRPVHRITVSARQIGGESLSRRLNQSGNDDELDRLTAVLNEMLQRLERQFRQIQQFTADAAHEIRTPITVLRGNAEVAISTATTVPELRSVLEVSIEEYDRLARIADDLLLLARADAGHGFLLRQPFSLQHALQDVVDLFTPLAQDKGIALAFTNGCAIDVHADGARVRQVISNLLDNALKHTPEGGRIEVALARRDHVAQLTVTDSGPGIPEEHLPFIFDRFYRADAARSRRVGGSGLGLAICRTIIDGHGGEITATNQANGACFTVRLPIHAPDSPQI